MYEDWPGSRNSHFYRSFNCAFFLGGQNFPWFWSFSRVPWNPWVPRSAIMAQGVAETRSSGGEENCIVHRLFHTLIILISISIFFVVLLHRLYLSPWVFPFAHCSSPSGWQREEWVSCCMVLVAGCRVKPQHTLTRSKQTPHCRYLQAVLSAFFRVWYFAGGLWEWADSSYWSHGCDQPGTTHELAALHTLSCSASRIR